MSYQRHKDDIEKKTKSSKRDSYKTKKLKPIKKPKYKEEGFN